MSGPLGTAAPLIELRGVEKRFGGLIAVREMNLAIPQGATYGLLGPNGAGKTTAIRMILGILEPDAGEIRLFGRPWDRGALDRIGYLPEERGLYKRMTVRRMLTFLAELKGVPARESSPRIAEWLERLELSDRANARVQELSKGNQQKIQFIGSILHDPEVVILDEPFSGLDPINQQVLKDIVQELRRRNRTIVFCTHIIEHAERVCDHVCIIARGQKVVDGTVDRVKREHGDEYVAIGFERRTPEADAVLQGSAAVKHLRTDGNDVEAALADGADANELLRQLVSAGVPLRRFERRGASLQQIFLERVGAAAGAERTVTEPEVVHV